jgi:hypothetical protein
VKGRGDGGVHPGGTGQLPGRFLRRGQPDDPGSGRPDGHAPGDRPPARHGRPPRALDLVEAAAGEIRLRCTLDEFGRLDPAEETELVDGGYGDAGAMGMGGSVPGMGLGYSTPLVVEHAVPLGDIEVERHESVHAMDGHIGQVEGFAVDPADQKVTHVLLKEGHLWGRRQVAIPVSAVASVDAGIRLNITKQQVEDLPPLGHTR